MEPTTDKVKVSKLDAAGRQLHTAIALYFADGDPVSVHTLAAAAHGLVEDLAAVAGQRTPIHQTLVDQLPPDLVEQVRKAGRGVQNFLKHADRDPTAELVFSQHYTELVLLDAIVTFAKIGGQITWPLEAFTKWFALQNPSLFASVEPWPTILRMAEGINDPSDRQAYYRDYRQSPQRNQ